MGTELKSQSSLQYKHKKVYKCGMGLSEDLDTLHSFARELSTRHFVCMHSPAIRAGFERRSLQVLTGILLGKRLSKKQQCSNWGREDLSVSQVQYAATDAWESRKVALKLQHLWLPGVEAGS